MGNTFFITRFLIFQVLLSVRQLCRAVSARACAARQFPLPALCTAFLSDGSFHAAVREIPASIQLFSLWSCAVHMMRSISVCGPRDLLVPGPEHRSQHSISIQSHLHSRSASRTILLVCHLFLLERCSAIRTEQTRIRVYFNHAVFHVFIIAFNPMPVRFQFFLSFPSI